MALLILLSAFNYYRVDKSLHISNANAKSIESSSTMFEFLIEDSNEIDEISTIFKFKYFILTLIIFINILIHDR
jgi:hypothetical protein